MELELSAYSLATLECNKKFLLGNPIEFYDKNLNKTFIKLNVEENVINKLERYDLIIIDKIQNDFNKI